MKLKTIYTIMIFLALTSKISYAQNALFIPPVLTGTNFNLNIQNGITQFYPGINTPTYGINGNILAPTLIVNKWDLDTFNITNSLTGSGNSTTIHWHGLHVPAKYDGGPHQVIPQGTTWRPNFRILNNAGTFWYHPHGDNKTDLHVSKGIAGMIIVKDSAESALTLPRTYGVDDFPIIVQTKAFDILNQIAIASEMDSTVCINGLVHPYINLPAQVIRLRLLNGASMRTFNFGFTNNQTFKMIASDGGLLDSAISLTRLRLSPGERAEILIDLQNLEGNTIFLKSFASELPNGIYGTGNLTGMGGASILDYNLNPLNGSDFILLQIDVTNQTLNPITTLPNLLVPYNPYTTYNTSRTFTLAPITMNPSNMLIGPFNINGVLFDMNTINLTTYLNDSEKWRIQNNTSIAHPFHIHDVEFDILNINGATVPGYERGKKDVVLVMPQQYVEFITKFEDFADDSIPYMYHCHLLHHEDDGMMGSFRVIDTTATNGIEVLTNSTFILFPNPVSENISIQFQNEILLAEINVLNILGEIVLKKNISNTNKTTLNTADYSNGIYFIQLQLEKSIFTKKFIKN